jgi:S1-C subfamily serine protease
VTHAGDLLPLLEEERIGQPLPIRLLRAGEVRELTVTVGVRGRRP